MTKKTPKGPTPSLIGGTNGRPRRRDVKRKSACYRCDTEIAAGQSCIEIPKLGSAYSSAKPVCDACFAVILQKTTSDLEELRTL